MATVTAAPPAARPLPRRLLRYVTGELALTVSFGLVAMVLFFTAANLIGNLSSRLRDGIPFSVILELELLQMPAAVVQVAWVAMLGGLLLVLGQMARHREYIAMLAGGVSLYQLSLPVLFVATLMSLGVFAVQEGLMPGARDLAATLRGIYARGGEADFRTTIPDITYTGLDHRTYLLRQLVFDRAEVIGVQMDRVEDNRIVESIYAEYGTWDARARRWIWHGGVRRTFDADQHITSEDPIDGYVSQLRASPEELRIEKRLSLNKYNLAYLSIAQLRRRIRTLASSGETPAKLWVTYYGKWAEPFATLVVALISLSWAVSVERHGMIRGVSICVAACVGFFVLREVGLTLGRGGALPPVLAAWGPYLLAGGCGVYWLRRAPT